MNYWLVSAKMVHFDMHFWVIFLNFFVFFAQESTDCGVGWWWLSESKSLGHISLVKMTYLSHFYKFFKKKPKQVKIFCLTAGL